MVSEKLVSYEIAATKYNFTKDKLDTIDVLKYTGKNRGFYIPSIHKKEKIVLHHTVGNLNGDVQTLTAPHQVSVAYLIGREGQILQLFNPNYWAYHLGKTALGGNITQSTQSIGIELSNYGFLTLKDGILYTAYNTPYCKLSDTDLYVKTANYRGYIYWCKYTDAQYVSLKNLLSYLTKVFNIPYEFLPVNKRMLYTTDVINFKGIVTHVNYRKSDKWDVSPAFDWDKIKRD